MNRTLIVPLIALALLAPLLPATAQVEANADLEVTSVSPGSPAVGAPRDIQTTVRNNGDSTALGLSAVFYWKDTGHPVTGAKESSRVSHGAPVAPGERVTLTLKWTPRASQAGAGMLIAVAETSDNNQDPDPGNNKGQASTFVTKPGVSVSAEWSTAPIEIEPGAEHPLPFKVKNTGNTEGTFVPELTEPGDTDWTLHITPSQATLLPGEVAKFVFTAQPPADAPAGQAVNETNGLDLDVIQQGYRDSDLGVADPVVPHLRVAAQRALALSVSDVDPAKPSTPITGTLTVENTGNTDERVSLDRSGSEGDAPPWWDLTFGSQRLDIGAGATAETTFQLNLTRNATAANYSLVFVANGTGGAVPPVTTATAALEVLQVHGVNLTASTTKLKLLPDQEGIFQLTVRNSGNGNDTFQVTSQKPGAEWAVTPRPKTTDLGPGEETIVELAVRPPAGTEQRQGAPLTARVSTGGGEARDTESVDLSVDVLAGPNIRIQELPTSLKVDPETGRTILLTLVNGGNRQGTATLDAEAPGDWGTSLSAVEADLEPLATRSVRLTVTAPQGAQPGDAADVTLEVDNQGDGPTHTDILPVLVGGPDLSVALESVPARIPAGELREVTVRVDSKGLRDAPATSLVLTAQGNRGTHDVASWELGSLGVGESLTRTASWNTTGWSGTVLLTARVDADNRIAEESEANNEATRSVFISTVNLQVDTPPPTTVDPGQSLKFTTPPLAIQVKNTGNDRSQVRVTITDEGGWVDETRTIELGAGSSNTVPLSLTVPRPTERLVNNLTVTAQPTAASSDRVASATWTLSVRDVAPPRLLELNFSEQPRWGVLAEHTVVWDDGTGLRGGFVKVTAPGGTSTDVPVEVARQRAFIAWAPDALGTHTLVANLEDLAGNQAPSRGIKVDVSAPPAPAISLADSNAVRPGSPVALNITSPAPLKEVASHTQGVRTVVFSPYRLNTTGWAEGTQEVRVVAVDVLDQRTEETFRIRVDGTPPAIKAASADPARPGTGEDVTVEITFDEPVSEASLVLVTEDDGRIRKDLTRSSDTVWRASFAMPLQAVGRVDVQATDTAGNAGLHQAAVDLETGRGIPAPGLWAVLAVVVGVGWLMRTREG